MNESYRVFLVSSSLSLQGEACAESSGLEIVSKKSVEIPKFPKSMDLVLEEVEVPNKQTVP